MGEYLEKLKKEYADKQFIAYQHPDAFAVCCLADALVEAATILANSLDPRVSKLEELPDTNVNLPKYEVSRHG